MNINLNNREEEKNASVYLVSRFRYDESDEIIGYFTSRRDAERYCLMNTTVSLASTYDIEEVECMDNSTELEDMDIKYTYHVIFDEKNDFKPMLCDNRDFYLGEYFKSNIVAYGRYSNNFIISINTSSTDNDEIIKEAESIFEEIKQAAELNECGMNSSCVISVIENINYRLSSDERERQEKEKFMKLQAAHQKIREEELKELKRLKEKYENIQ